jgi:hypothetical protein
MKRVDVEVDGVRVTVTPKGVSFGEYKLSHESWMLLSGATTNAVCALQGPVLLRSSTAVPILPARRRGRPPGSGRRKVSEELGAPGKTRK